MSFSEYFQATSGLGDAFADAFQRREAQKLLGQQLDAALAAQGQSTALGGLNGLQQPPQTPLAALGAPTQATAPNLPTFAQGSDIGRYANSISKIESGGRYDIVGPTHPKYGRALGKYQVMEANLPQWSQEALGRTVTAQEFLNTPAIQDAIFSKRFGDAVQKYGNPQDAASVWFTGRPVAQGRNSKDSLGTSGQKYVDMFTANLGRASAGAAPALPQTVMRMPGAAPGASQMAMPAPQMPGQPPQQMAQADMPAPGAQPIAGFAVPQGQSADFVPGTEASPALAQGRAPEMGAGLAPAATQRLSPAQADNLRAMLRNPYTAPQAAKIIEGLNKPDKFSFQVVGDQLVRTSEGGRAEVVPNITKPPTFQIVKGSDGNDYILNPQTGQTTRAIQGRNQGVRDLTAEEKAARGIEPSAFAQIDGDGNVKFPGRAATQVNIDNKGETEFAKKAQGGLADRFLKIAEEGDAARSEAALLGQLSGLGSVVGTGAMAATQAWLADKGVKIGDNVGAVEAYGALVDKLVPAQRVPGSGTTSDFDAKGFKASLPRLMNTPEGNALIIGTLQALNEWKVARASIAEKALTGDLRPADVVRQLSALPNPNTAFRSGLEQLRKDGRLSAEVPANVGAGQPRQGSPSLGVGGTTVIDGVTIRRVN